MNHPDGYDALGATICTLVVLAAVYFLAPSLQPAADAVSIYQARF